MHCTALPAVTNRVTYQWMCLEVVGDHLRPCSAATRTELKKFCLLRSQGQPPGADLTSLFCVNGHHVWTADARGSTRAGKH